MHTTMQMLGRVAIIGGTVLVSLANVVMFQGSEALPEAEKVAIYLRIYELALIIPLLSVSGVLLGGAPQAPRGEAAGRAWAQPRRHRPPAPRPGRNSHAQLVDPRRQRGVRGAHHHRRAVGIEYGQEIIFAASFAIIGFMISRLLRELSPEAARTLLGTVIIIFAFRALPGPGAGASWWMIDELGFDQSFLSRLDLITSALTLAGLFLFRRFMAEKSIAQIVIFLTVATTALSAADHRHVPRPARMDRGAHRRRGRRALHRHRQHRARVPARPGVDGADAGVDRQLRAATPQGDLLRGDGLVHQPSAVGLPARHQVPQPALRDRTRGEGRGHRGDHHAGRLRRARCAASSPPRSG
jgi:hypothetical protein